MALTQDLGAATAGDLAGMVRAGAASPEEVVRAHLERIERLDRRFSAFEQVRGERALREAAELVRRTDLSSLPLAGVPVAIKDNVDVAGEPTRHGSRATPATPAAADSEVVRRLRAAGCIVIGKTRMPELAIWPLTEPANSPPARNPWDPSRTPGGSTGGGAVAVATAMTPLALGSDGGGSIRLPAACCGIAGLKPGPGLVPTVDGLPHWFGLTSWGPMARSTADLGLMLDVLAGTDRFRATAPGVRLRIAVSTAPATAGTKVDPEIGTAIERLAAALESAGHTVVRADPPYPPDLGLRFMKRWLGGIAQDAAGLRTGDLEPRTRGMVRAGRLLGGIGAVRLAEADRFARRARDWIAAHDILLCPVMSEPPVEIGRWASLGWIRMALAAGGWVCTTPWNLAGLPAASVPAGQTAGGLPIGAQLIAGPGREDVILDLMAEIERDHPWPRWSGA